ncbi:MAG: protein-L-isoaspartate(D-aspartate) O-methyltransferase [Desulfuromonadaceae bacterium]|nr:protein-L-isoaspartate(D-aspartate) O-methyltransferase [Desulfuromonadaceae bacterium]
MSNNFSVARRLMVDQQLRLRGISDPLVIAAMLSVPRHLFVEEAFQSRAYSDAPLPIGSKQTISQPFMVAFMTAALELQGTEKVLEIGTGSGYQAAVLATIVDQVFTVERLPELARRARRILDLVGAARVNLKVSDGTFGWEEQQPFDAIMVTAGSPETPRHLLDQLKIGGRLVIPVGDQIDQLLKRYRRTDNATFTEETLLGCRFVPLIGRYGWSESDYS